MTMDDVVHSKKQMHGSGNVCPVQFSGMRIQLNECV